VTYDIVRKKLKLMNTLQDASGTKKIVFLTQEDKDFLIYMCSDVWITPEIKRFKNDLLEKAWSQKPSQ